MQGPLYQCKTWVHGLNLTAVFQVICLDRGLAAGISNKLKVASRFCRLGCRLSSPDASH